MLDRIADTESIGRLLYGVGFDPIAGTKVFWDTRTLEIGRLLPSGESNPPTRRIQTTPPMNSSMQQSRSQSLARSDFGDNRAPSRSTVSWGAIIAGAIAALALQVLFMMLAAGLGLAIYSPATGDDPVSSLSRGALLIHSICAIVSLCLGGWVAGRFAPVCARATGWLHGFTVWCAATVGGVLLVAFGAGALLGGLSKVVGGGLSAVGESVSSVAGGAADLAGNVVDQSGETITSFVDEAVNNLPEDGPANERIRATREVGLALGRLFNPMQEGDTTANRADAVTALVDHTEMTQAEADRAVTEWTGTFEGLQADLAALQDSAETQAREAADTAAGALAEISLWSFFGFLLGALAATGGGHLGAKSATRCDETTDDARSARDKTGEPLRSEPAPMV